MYRNFIRFSWLREFAKLTALDSERWKFQMIQLLAPQRFASLPAWWRYSMAVGIAVLATALRYVLVPWVGTIVPYNLWIVGVAATTVLFGIGPGLLYAVLGVVGVEVFVLQSLPTLYEAKTIARIATTSFAGVVVALMIHAIRIAAIQARLSADRLSTFAAATFEGIVESEAGRILDCNTQFARLTGYTVEELKGMAIADLIAPEDRDRVLESLQLNLESVVEHAMLCRDGTRIVVEARQSSVIGSCSCYTVVRDITPRKRAEELAHQRLEELEDLYRKIPVGLCVLDRNLRFVRINERLAEINGIPRSEHIGKTVRDLLPQIADTTEQEMQNVLRTGEPRLDIEIVSETPAQPGVQRSWTEQWLPLKDAEGRVFGMSIVAEETTNRKRAEEKLRQSEERLQQALLVSRSFTFEWKPDTDKVLRSESCATILKLAGNEISHDTGQRFFQRVHPDDRSRLIQILHDLTPAESTYSTEYKVVNSDGTIVVLEDFAQATFNAAGKLERIVGVTTDITERKQVEKALERSERKYRQIFETSNSMMVISSFADGRIIDVNGTFCRNLGYARDALVGNTGEWMRLWAVPEDRKRVIDLLQIQGRLDHEEVKVRTKAGDVRVTLLAAVCVNIDEEPFIVTSLIDITERKQFEEQLRALNEELEQRVESRTRELQESQRQILHAEKLAAIGRLSASIAHEFNNPLQSIMTILKGFQKTLTLENQDRVFLDLAFSESDRMKNLIRSLQVFNRPSSGRKELMDVHETIDPLLVLSKSDLKRKEISIKLKYDKNLPQIVAIPDQIKQVLLNLLQNAADACTGSKGVITISTYREDKKIAIAIEDNGIGIAPDKLTQIFQPFYSTKPEVKGTGLGLSISHGIVQDHQGEIRVESEPDKGSTFTVLLPIVGENK